VRVLALPCAVFVCMLTLFSVGGMTVRVTLPNTKLMLGVPIMTY
jgi:hypothetical protein